MGPEQRQNTGKPWVGQPVYGLRAKEALVPAGDEDVLPAFLPPHPGRMGWSQEPHRCSPVNDRGSEKAQEGGEG